MTLTHLQIANAKPQTKPYKLTDSGGLHLAVQPSGAKLWRMNYRYLGRQKTLHIGAWPAVGIGVAREQRDDARKQIAFGRDPAAEKRVATLARKVAAPRRCSTRWASGTRTRSRSSSPISTRAWCGGLIRAANIGTSACG